MLLESTILIEKPGFLNTDFPKIQNSYSRNIIFQVCNSTFEILVIRWDQNTDTPIHGYPDFIFVYFLATEFSTTNYNQANQQITPTHTQRYTPKDYIDQHEKKDRLDNHIHQVTANTQGLSFHIYSNDSQKGQQFNQ